MPFKFHSKCYFPFVLWVFTFCCYMYSSPIYDKKVYFSTIILNQCNHKILNQHGSRTDAWWTLLNIFTTQSVIYPKAWEEGFLPTDHTSYSTFFYTLSRIAMTELPTALQPFCSRIQEHLKKNANTMPIDSSKITFLLFTTQCCNDHDQMSIEYSLIFSATSECHFLLDN